MGDERNSNRILVGKLKEVNSLKTYEDDIKMDPKGVGLRVFTGFVQRRTGAGGVLS
jgi:hypothetical protein